MQVGRQSKVVRSEDTANFTFDTQPDKFWLRDSDSAVWHEQDLV